MAMRLLEFKCQVLYTHLEKENHFNVVNWINYNFLLWKTHILDLCNFAQSA